MKKLLLPAISLLLSISLMAGERDSVVSYALPDSVKAIQFMADISISSLSTVKEAKAGIQTDVVKLYLEADKDEKEIVFSFHSSAAIMVAGIGTDAENGEIEWEYDWTINETYKLLIATAGDSAGNFSLYTGYIFLPQENKWKMLGTCKITGRWNTIQSPSSFTSRSRKSKITTSIGQVWCQRNTGSWRNLKNEDQLSPLVNLFGHIDSVKQREDDIKRIEIAISSRNTDVRESTEGVYYRILKEGTGRQVTVNDTVTVFYKLTLLNDTVVIDQAKDKPATFPLKRLIRGWQIGVPLLKVGGKIKLVIPSDIAYSIRTRSPKIPPNSILVFEIEVLEARAPVN